MILKEGQKPNNILFNSKNNILITQYENSYLTVFNTKDLKLYGKKYIYQVKIYLNLISFLIIIILY